MKKLLLSCLTLVSCLLQSQTLTQSFNEPKPGETESNYALDTSAFSSGLPLNVTGNGVTWDFTKLKAINATITNNYLSAASVSNASNYAGCTFVQESSGVYSYFKSTTTPTPQTEILGIQTSSLSANFTNSGIIARYPVVYGSSTSDNMSGTFNFSVTGTCSGKITTSADGLGTLNLPQGISLTNVLRVKSVQTLTFTASLIPVGSIRQTIYNYYHASEKFPVLSLNYTYMSTSFSSTPTITGFATGNTGFFVTGIHETDAVNASLLVYPNPAQNTVYISSSAVTVRSVKVLNQLGQTIMSGGESSSVDISGLESGIYFIEISTDLGQSRKKIVKN